MILEMCYLYVTVFLHICILLYEYVLEFCTVDFQCYNCMDLFRSFPLPKRDRAILLFAGSPGDIGAASD